MKTKKHPPRPDCCAECGGVIGYDAYVDSNGDVVSGPFQHNVCTRCDRENPPVAGANTEEDDE